MDHKRFRLNVPSTEDVIVGDLAAQMGLGVDRRDHESLANRRDDSLENDDGSQAFQIPAERH